MQLSGYENLQKIFLFKLLYLVYFMAHLEGSFWILFSIAASRQEKKWTPSQGDFCRRLRLRPDSDKIKKPIYEDILGFKKNYSKIIKI